MIHELNSRNSGGAYIYNWTILFETIILLIPTKIRRYQLEYGNKPENLIKRKGELRKGWLATWQNNEYVIQNINNNNNNNHTKNQDFIFRLKLDRDGKHLIEFGRLFQSLGPWKQIVIWRILVLQAILRRSFLKRVSWLCIELPRLKRWWSNCGTNWFRILYM